MTSTPIHAKNQQDNDGQGALNFFKLYRRNTVKPKYPQQKKNLGIRFVIKKTRITNEHLMLKASFERELKLIEDLLTANRNCILDAHKDELGALISKRKEE